MDHILYLDGTCGISGDMTVAALLDLGASREKMDAALASLKIDGFHCHVSRTKTYGIEGCDFDVHLHEEEHHHEHHGHEHHHHEHRNLADVYEVIDRGELTVRASDLARTIFRIVAEAESRAHGVPIEEVHFHEVGALDSIADIVAAAVLIDDLDVKDCVITGFQEGTGFVHCQHGDLPVPVPAVLNIVQKYSIPLRPSQVQGEMVTPTGIAIAAAIRTMNKLPDSAVIERVGIGIGKRDFGRANFLRAMLLRNDGPADRVMVMETNIDDTTGEMMGHALEELFKLGVRDAHFVPCFMKKNRPGYLLRVIADESMVSKAEEVIFRETTTIGIRRYPVERTLMTRSAVELETPYGKVKGKLCEIGNIRRCYPEYESVRELSDRTGTSYSEIYNAAISAGESHPEA